jgi:16S rRNA (guanine966-N2)-methyltransferase
MLRVVSGTVGGLRLKTPKGVEIRPTQDRIKQVIFSSLVDWVENASVLDLYAGTGALGIEALSHGAKQALFVEKEEKCAKAIEQNLELCKFTSLARVRKMDVETFLKSPATESFDLVFADPPYQKIYGTLDDSHFLEWIRPWVKESGLFVWEHYSGQKLSQPQGWTIVRDRDYGETGLTFLKRA